MEKYIKIVSLLLLTSLSINSASAQQLKLEPVPTSYDSTKIIVKKNKSAVPSMAIINKPNLQENKQQQNAAMLKSASLKSGSTKKSKTQLVLDSLAATNKIQYYTGKVSKTFDLNTEETPTKPSDNGEKK